MPNINDNISGVFGNSAGAPLVRDGYVTVQSHNTLKGRGVADVHPASSINWTEYDTNALAIANEVKAAPNKYALKASLGTSSSKDVGNSTGEIPDKEILDSRLGTTNNLGNVATRSVGSNKGQIPDKEILDARLGTISKLGTVATRSVGSSTGQIPDKEILDTRLGTSGNLGGAATRSVGGASGNLMEVGAFGLGSGKGAVSVSDFDTILSNSIGATIFVKSTFRPTNPPTVSDNWFAGVFRVIYTNFYVYEIRAAANQDKSFTWKRHYSPGGGGWGNWVREYDAENVIGSVSQSGGVPTGAIIESGSNSNGSYIKWADGTLICDNNNNAITRNPAAFVGSVTSIDGNKLRIGKWF